MRTVAANVGLQKAAAEAPIEDFNGLGGFGGYGRTPEGELITAAFVDAYNKLVDQIRTSAPQASESPTPSRDSQPAKAAPSASRSSPALLNSAAACAPEAPAGPAQGAG